MRAASVQFGTVLASHTWQWLLVVLGVLIVLALLMQCRITIIINLSARIIWSWLSECSLNC